MRQRIKLKKKKQLRKLKKKSRETCFYEIRFNERNEKWGNRQRKKKTGDVRKRKKNKIKRTKLVGRRERQDKIRTRENKLTTNNVAHMYARVPLYIAWEKIHTI